MSQKIFATSSFSSLGCTFLDWTLHYLSGKTEYYNVELDRNVELVDNPLKLFDQTNNKKMHIDIKKITRVVMKG